MSKRKLGEHVSSSVDDLLGDEPWGASYACRRKKSGHLTHLQLVNNVLCNKRTTLNWCYDNSLLCDAPACPKCNFSMTLKKECSANASSHALIWSCRRQIEGKRCDKYISIKKGSWFDKANITIAEVLHVTFAFTHAWPQTAVTEEIGLCSRTAVDWYSFCREFLLALCMEMKEKIGGPGKTVEIGESKFGHRKHYRGNHVEVEGQWVFGGVECESGNLFLVLVEKWDSDTLIPIIKDWILPGTTITSDCWKAYACLKDEHYGHLTLNHGITFKNPETGPHNNTTEGAWLHAKSKRNFPKCGTKKEDFMAGYLATRMWRRSVTARGADPFMSFLDDVKKLYVPDNWKIPMAK